MSTMESRNLRRALIVLYSDYLKETVKQRTVTLQDMEGDGTKDVEMKGDFDSFIYWLSQQDDEKE